MEIKDIKNRYLKDFVIDILDYDYSPRKILDYAIKYFNGDMNAFDEVYKGCLYFYCIKCLKTCNNEEDFEECFSYLGEKTLIYIGDKSKHKDCFWDNYCKFVGRNIEIFLNKKNNDNTKSLDYLKTINEDNDVFLDDNGEVFNSFYDKFIEDVDTRYWFNIIINFLNTYNGDKDYVKEMFFDYFYNDTSYKSVGETYGKSHQGARVITNYMMNKIRSFNCYNMLRDNETNRDKEEKNKMLDLIKENVDFKFIDFDNNENSYLKVLGNSDEFLIKLLPYMINSIKEYKCKYKNLDSKIVMRFIKDYDDFIIECIPSQEKSVDNKEKCLTIK